MTALSEGAMAARARNVKRRRIQNRSGILRRESQRLPVATTTTPATAAAAAATTAILRRIDIEAATVELATVHLFTGAIGISSISEGNETEAAATAGVAVRDDLGISNLTKLLES
jgi:hypothetical protein